MHAGRRSAGRALGVGVLSAVVVLGCGGTPAAGLPTGAQPTAARPTTRTAGPTATDRPAASVSPVAPSALDGPTGATQIAVVTRVTDGDTIRVLLDGVSTPIRYIGIDTPEPDDPDPTQRALAEAATAANAALVDGREVVLERDVSDVDQFDRRLRNVWVQGPDGALLHVGLELVRTGFAQVSTFPPDVRYADRLLAAQEEARTAGLGLWAPGTSPGASPIGIAGHDFAVVSLRAPTAFVGGSGDHAWSQVTFDTNRATVRWDVRAGGADCQVGWALAWPDRDPIRSTIRVDAGDRERDSRRYDISGDSPGLLVRSTCPDWVITMQAIDPSSTAACDDSYVDVCIPPYPPDLDCPDIPFTGFEVRGADPHGFDREGDGIGCEGP